MMPPPAVPPTTLQSWPAGAPGSGPGPRSQEFTYGMAVASAATKGWPHPKSSLASALRPMRSARARVRAAGVMPSLSLARHSTGIWSRPISSHVSCSLLASSCLTRPSIRSGSPAPTCSSRVRRVCTIAHSAFDLSLHSSSRSLLAWNAFLTTLSSTVTPGAYHSWIGYDDPPVPPVAQQHSTSLLMRCGCRIAKCWATMPPKDTPRTCTGSLSGTTASSNAAASSA
mmetsp:Transcript_56044/g.151160  ORF Transcript_56044/g.151160 Transcript_56044/m.151160 type:complete len:227 (+) Transcript_56044:293-973(+)